MSGFCMLYFLKKYFSDKDKILYPHKPLTFKTDIEELKLILNGTGYDEDYKILFQEIRKLKENIPPLINAYMNLSPTMRTFGTAINEHFGGVEETGLMVTINDIYDIKIDRHISSYKK